MCIVNKFAYSQQLQNVYTYDIYLLQANVGGQGDETSPAYVAMAAKRDDENIDANTSHKCCVLL